MRYICEEYPTPGTPNFYGSTLIDKARVNQWLEVEGQQTCPILRDIYYPFLVESLGGKKVDHEIVAQNIEKLAKVLDVYEAHLSKNKYLAGSFVSIADLSHLLTCYLVFNLFKQADHELLKTRKHVSAWWDDISNRPAWLTVVRNASPVFDTWKSSNGVQ
jgi:glutathione S-transferase